MIRGAGAAAAATMSPEPAQGRGQSADDASAYECGRGPHAQRPSPCLWALLEARANEVAEARREDVRGGRCWVLDDVVQQVPKDEPARPSRCVRESARRELEQCDAWCKGWGAAPDAGAS